jgi:hypothetical protein
LIEFNAGVLKLSANVYRLHGDEVRGVHNKNAALPRDVIGRSARVFWHGKWVTEYANVANGPPFAKLRMMWKVLGSGLTA